MVARIAVCPVGVETALQLRQSKPLHLLCCFSFGMVGASVGKNCET